MTYIGTVGGAVGGLLIFRKQQIHQSQKELEGGDYRETELESCRLLVCRCILLYCC